MEPKDWLIGALGIGLGIIIAMGVAIIFGISLGWSDEALGGMIGSFTAAMIGLGGVFYIELRKKIEEHQLQSRRYRALFLEVWELNITYRKYLSRYREVKNTRDPKFWADIRAFHMHIHREKLQVDELSKLIEGLSDPINDALMMLYQELRVARLVTTNIEKIFSRKGQSVTFDDYENLISRSEIWGTSFIGKNILVLQRLRSSLKECPISDNDWATAVSEI